MRFRNIKNNAVHTGVVFLSTLALRDGAHGAGVSAGTAIQASTGVDFVMISTLSNGAHGASIGAGTTADASIANDIGHN